MADELKKHAFSEQTKLVEWLDSVVRYYEPAMADPVVREHVEFLKRAVDWIRTLDK